MTRGLRVLLCCGIVVVPRMAIAQLPVIDHANLVQNTISAVQAVAIVANQIIELTALPAFAVELAELSEDLAAVEGFVLEAQALGWELQSLQAQIIPLFSLEGAPTTSWEYRQRTQEISRAIFQAYSYAMRTQTLIRSLLRTVRHITSILGQVSEAIGNLTVSQTLGQSQAKLEQLLTESNLQRAAYERAQSLEGAAPGVLLQGIQNINDAIMEGHPR